MTIKYNKKKVFYLLMASVLATVCNHTQLVVHAEQAEQSDAVVSYLGPEGTYSQEACMHFFGEEGSYIPFTTVAETVEALIAGDSDYAVIPQENTIGGPVIEYVDTLISQKDVSIVGEVELPIRQNLLGIEGAKLSDIQTVYSHKQGILQGADWLKENVPQAEVIEVSSTAEGAKMVSESQDPSEAAIASAACVPVYQLEMLAESIQENDNNVTRFYVLSKEEAQKETSDRLAFIATGNAKGLPDLLAKMDQEDMTLVTIHDRPRKTVLGEYDYVIECEDATYDAYCELEEIQDFSLRYLGSFELAEEDAGTLKAGFSYIHDPRENPHAMKDIVENPNAVYGFSPDPNSDRLGSYAEYDWTDAETVEAGRQERIAYHNSIEEMMVMLKQLRDEGKSIEEIARTISEERNKIRLESYKDDPVGLKKVKESNLETYGNENGPTADSLYEKYGSWETVLQKAFGTNPGMDACVGLYDDYYDLYEELGMAK